MDKTLDRIERLENKALELGDLKTAIKLNWLYNAVKFNGFDRWDAEELIQCITRNNQWYNINEL